MKKYKKDHSLNIGIYLVILLTLFIWHRLLGQALLGEGPYYFSEPWNTEIFRHGYFPIFDRYDVQTLLFFRLVGDVAKMNMGFYMGFLLLGITLVNCGLYLWVREVTKSTVAGVISSALFIANFIGSFQIIAIGVYPYFIQRVPQFALAFASLVLLSKFLNTKKVKYYVFSLLLIAIGMFLAHYTLLIFPVFLLYVGAYCLFEGSFSIKRCVQGFAYMLPFMALGYFVYYLESGKGTGEFTQLIFEEPGIASKVLSKLTIMTFPRETILFISKALSGWVTGGVESYIESIAALSSLVGALYLAVASYIFVKYKKYRTFLFTVFLSIPVSLIMALYLRVSILNETGSNRYLYVPSMFVSAFWGLAFYILMKKKTIFKILIPVLLIFYVLFERNLILQNFDATQPKHDLVHAAIFFLQTERGSLPDNSIVMFPTTNGSCHVQAYNRFFGERGIKYAADTSNIPYIVSTMEVFSGNIVCLDDSTGSITSRMEKYKLDDLTPCAI